MSKILDLATNFEKKSKEQASDIDKELKNVFRQHSLSIQKELKRSENTITNAIIDSHYRIWKSVKVLIALALLLVVLIGVTISIWAYRETQTLSYLQETSHSLRLAIEEQKNTSAELIEKIERQRLQSKELIADIQKKKAIVERLKAQGSDLKFVRCGKHWCIPKAKYQYQEWRRAGDNRQMFIPEGY